ncbi:hypothetical protein AB0C07_09160 [Actinoplanes missouriensis]|uniref:hypothetical protein n=1 Tax=Actinoplanes missouriensis TaxID=1866 RepID=UPI0033F6F157
MRDDELYQPPAPTRRSMVPRTRRLLSPAGLIMAGLCLLLPFMSASCESGQQQVRWRVTYTGVDVIAGGKPAVAFTDDVIRRPMRTLDAEEERRLLGTSPTPLPPQPVAWMAVALMTAALAATALPSRYWRATATAGLALPAAVLLVGATMLARRDATDAVAAVLSRTTSPEVRRWEHYGQVSDMFGYTYGLWIAVGTLSAVGVVNLVGAVSRR